MTSLIAQVGNITNPFLRFPGAPASLRSGVPGEGVIVLLNSLFNFAVVLAGIYSLFNFIMAGYQFLSAGGEPKNISKAWEKIWQSLLGLLIVASSLLLAMIAGQLIFGNSQAIVRPRIYTP